MKILLVEDNHDVAESLIGALNTSGHEVFWSVSLEQARTALDLTSERPEIKLDAVILDNQLADGFGTELIAEVKALGLPAVLYSGLPPDEDIGIPKIVKSRPHELLDWIEKIDQGKSVEASS